jgi:hypothetical protein
MDDRKGRFINRLIKSLIGKLLVANGDQCESSLSDRSDPDLGTRTNPGMPADFDRLGWQSLESRSHYPDRSDGDP